jgi:hypothetical protein
MFYYQSVYSYDIPACHYNILKNSGFDVSHLPVDDKFERNKLIGLMMRDDKNLTKFLRQTTIKVIDYYIETNEIKKSELLLRQYDGLYTTKKLCLKHNPIFPIKLELKNFYPIFLFSICKTMYIASDDKNNLLVKGVPDKYPEIENFYQQLLTINYLSKKSISVSLNMLKEKLFSDDNLALFLIPNDRGFKLYLDDFGEMIISKKAIKMVDINEIDKYQYFSLYLEPFFKAIVFDLL